MEISHESKESDEDKLIVDDEMLLSDLEFNKK
jgi:hypothetical protein